MEELEDQNNLREVERVIVSAVIFSKDGKMLMGRKDPIGGGVYSDAWHIPGGGVEDGENLEETLKREVDEETGINISEAKKVTKLPEVRQGIAQKFSKELNEIVTVKMEFNVYEVHLDKFADEIDLNPQEDLVKLRWFTPEEITKAKLIPGGKEFFGNQGYITKA